MCVNIHMNEKKNIRQFPPSPSTKKNQQNKTFTSFSEKIMLILQKKIF